MDRRDFLSSFLGVSSAEGLSSLKAIALDPTADLPSLKAAAELEKGKPDNEKFWSKVRDFFYVPEDILYLNNGSLGLSHRPVVEAMYRHLLESESVRTRKYPEYPWWGYGPSLEVRQRVASFVGADPKEIALTRNATEGMNTVATGLDLAAGDEVLMTNQEHPGGKSAWYLRAKRFGIVVREFELPMPPATPAEILNRLEAAITSRTRVISVSHITTVTGGLLPVKEISALARSKNIISLIDGAHAIGQIPLDLKDMGCDYYATSPHKWLYAPKGTGILFCRTGMAEKLWCHTASSGWDQPELGCERLTHIGTSNYSLLAGMVASMDFQDRLGKELIAERGRYLNRYLRKLLEGIEGAWFMNGPPSELSAAMVKLALPFKKLGDFPKRMWDKERIWLATADGDGPLPASIRFALPIYIRTRDLDRAVSLIKTELKRRPL